MIRIALLPLATLILGLLLTANDSAPKSGAGVYPEHLPGAFTGGFGEETCHSCHFDYPLNSQKGSLSIEGFPNSYEAGETYTFTILIKREQLGQAGFQLSSRFEDGSQAGSFQANSDRLSFTEVKTDIQYLQHTLKGSKVAGQTSASWKITWIAPDAKTGNVIFNLSANAGNGDASAFGDFIYTRQIEIPGVEN